MDEANNSLDDSGITMVDVLKEEEEMEKDAQAVLGAGDDTICTYENGYMKRQALYGCITCNPVESETNVKAGVCLGCSYHCHEGHELVELYTKRNFRCDCGNSKFKGTCKLYENKDEVNEKNVYNQNFVGKYCTCHRPYPDPEDNTNDQMIQCILCEDWYHGLHLECKGIPEEDDYSEMICHQCPPKYDFLKYYNGFEVTKVKKDSSEETEVSIEEKAAKELSQSNQKEELPHSSKTEEMPPSNIKEEIPTSTHKEVSSNQKLEVTPKCLEVSIEGCNLSSFKVSEDYKLDQAMFFPENWRKHLCKCDSCSKMYSEKGVEFLINEDDTVSYYESQGKAKENARRGQTPEQREAELLSSFDRITMTEMMHEYNNLSSSLREYLKKFAENGKMVRDEDVREFFADFSAKKRQRQNNGIPYFCR